MKKNLKKLLAVALSLGLTLGMIPATGAAFAAEKQDGLAELAKQLQNTNQDPFRFRTSKSKAKLRASTPTSLDLRDQNLVTPVKFQNPFGTCWGFAAIATAETSLLGSGLAQKDGYDASTLNLSEKHLVNFVARALNDPTNPQNGEGMTFEDPNLRVEDRFAFGGVPFYATSLFSSGIGPNLEDRPISDKAPAGTTTDIYEYHGLNKETEKRDINNNGEWVDFCYSDDDDWSIPEELRFTQSYVLKESYMLPSPAEQEGEGEDAKYVYNPDGTAAIKDELMQNRAVQIGFCADQSKPNEIGDQNYISRNWAHYTYERADANHAVTIVGWDDNYPKENFVQGHEPPENGAWLVKNSWGSGEVPFPDYGAGNWGLLQGQDKAPYEATSDVHTGYFWLSYYDQSLCMPEALAFDKSNVNQQYYLDQHDLMPVSDVMAADVDTETCMSNVFKADVAEQLEQISCVTAAPGTTAKYEIYLLQPNYESPLDGVLAASGEASFKYGGFHKIHLDKPVLIQKDQYYSIVITQLLEDKYIINIPMSNGETAASLFEQPFWEKGIINKGESFMKYQGKWYDYSDPATQSMLLGGLEYLMALDNFPIKGYCTERDALRMTVGQGNSITLDLADSMETTLTAQFKGKGDMPNPLVITWTPSEGSDKYFDVVPDEKKPQNCKLIAKTVGTSYVTVTAEGIGSQVVKVTVSPDGKYMAYDLGMSYGGYDDLIVYDQSLNPAEGPFTYKSSNTKVVTVSAKGHVKAVGVGNAAITATDSVGARAVFNVEIYKAENTLDVVAKNVKVKYSALKKKAQKIKPAKAMKVKKPVGKVTYLKKKGNKAITVNKKTGKITIKKGLKKGTYKLKVQVKAAGNKNYEAAKQVVTVVIKVS